jgi:hypothetical protein
VIKIRDFLTYQWHIRIGVHKWFLQAKSTWAQGTLLPGRSSRGISSVVTSRRLDTMQTALRTESAGSACALRLDACRPADNRRYARGMARDLSRHPHLQREPYGRLDSVYLASRDRLPLGKQPSQNGFGLFGLLRPELILSAEGGTRSRWKLPLDFMPGTRTPLSYHGDAERWKPLSEHSVGLQLVARARSLCWNLISIRAFGSG